MKRQKKTLIHVTFKMSESNVPWQLVVLTAAHEGLLHSPNVGATQVTGLHNADLVRAETVIQRSTELLRRWTDGA